MVPILGGKICYTQNVCSLLLFLFVFNASYRYLLFLFIRGIVDFLVLTFLEFRLLEKKCSGRYLAYRKQYNFLLKYRFFLKYAIPIWLMHRCNFKTGNTMEI